MTFLAPWVLGGAVAAALGVLALHLIARARPPEAPLPTARFVPDAPAHSTTRTSRPADPWLLLLRVLALLLLGAALARPVRTPERVGMRQLLLVDVSRDGAAGAARDSALARLHTGDAVILFDTVAVTLHAASHDSLRAGLGRVEPGSAPARLSVALVAASRMAAALADSTDSLRLVLVSPLVRGSVDAATAAVRERWPATIEIVRVAAADADSAPVRATGRAPVRATGRATVRAAGDDDDPLVAAVALAGGVASAPVRVLRGRATAADSTWARDSGGVLVVWPEAVPDGWSAREVADTLGAVMAEGADGDGATLVAPLMRRARAPVGLAVRARWVDGEPAAVEAPLGAGCVRTVGVPLDGTGDLVLRAAFGRFLAEMLAPCGGRRDLTPLMDPALRALRGGGAPAGALHPGRTRGESLAAWPLALGILLLIGELAVRRRGEGMEA